MRVESAKSDFSNLKQFNELKLALQKKNPKYAEGAPNALRGFEHQFLLTLQKVVDKWKETPESERQTLAVARQVVAEVVSDITEIDQSLVIVTQVKTTLSSSGLTKALKELWEIFNLATEQTPELVEHLQFVISGKFEGVTNPQTTINNWNIKSNSISPRKLKKFKQHVRCEIVHDPKTKLLAELRALSIEDPEATIKCWLGSFFGLGSGISSELITTLICKDLLDDQGTKAIRISLERVMSVSRNHLVSIQTTLGKDITFPRAKLEELRESILKHKVTLLVGPSGSGKSALCKLCIQKDSTEAFEYLFLNASDITTFIQNSEPRRLDEILTAQITQKPILIVIDDLGDASQTDAEAALTLLSNSLGADQFADVRFLITIHPETKTAIREKIGVELRDNSICHDVELPQLPIEELQSCKALPDDIKNLVNRHQEFGPALNLKMLDYLVRDSQENQNGLPVFKSDLDLLDWVWQVHIKNGDDSSNVGQTLIQISEELASEFTPDIPRDLTHDSNSLNSLVSRDCLRLTHESITLTHRFIGDCARFYRLQSKRRKINSQILATYLNNPFWVQPIRWFMLQLALNPEGKETWQELLFEALDGQDLNLLNLLLDGAILSKQTAFVLQGCSDAHLPFIIECLIKRLLEVATHPYPLSSSDEPKSLQIEITIQEAITGIPKADLWLPVWRWILSQSQDDIIKQSGIVFKAAEAWLNWSITAIKFPMRTEIASLALDLAENLLLNDADKSARTYKYLGDYKTSAFACIVFSLGIIPDYSSWFLRVLAGRELVPANTLAPKQEITGNTPSDNMMRLLQGNGVLQPGHSEGPVGIVNDEFRKFMLSRNGLYLDAVIRAYPKLGLELFFALTIEQPQYLYERERRRSIHDHDFGTAGSGDIDVCTFAFLPLLSLLTINETIAMRLVNTLCHIVFTNQRKRDQHLENKRGTSNPESKVDQFIDPLKSDAYELNLLIDGKRKCFIGERGNLYWHRNHPRSPKILNCLLMTVEGWLYSRPTKKHLDNSITIIFQESNTVAFLGILASLAKCDIRLLSDNLLPLVSSLQLLLWLESEFLDRQLQGYGPDIDDVWNLPDTSRQELLSFYELSHREHELKKIILNLWVDRDIPLNIQSNILADWDNYQLTQISDVSRSQALKIREQFRLDNWQEEVSEGESRFRFVGQILRTLEEEIDATRNVWHLSALDIFGNALKLLEKEQEKTLDLHNQFLKHIESEKALELLKENLNTDDFWNVVWASVAVISTPPIYSGTDEVNELLTHLASSLLSYPVTASARHRQNFEPYSFIARAAPILIKRLQSEEQMRVAAFRCFVGFCNTDTCKFMYAWIEEYGINDATTQQLINIVPYVSRLIALTNVLATERCIKNRVRPDGTYTLPNYEEVEQEIHQLESHEIGKSWNLLQSQFSKNTVSIETFHESARWMPENLSQSFCELSEWQKNLAWELDQNPFDWTFLTSALMPVFEFEDQSRKSFELTEKLSNELINELIYQRSKLHEQEKSRKKSGPFDDEASHYLSKSQLDFLNVALFPNFEQTEKSLSQLLDIFASNNFIDFYLLENVVDRLIAWLIQEKTDNELLRNDSTFTNISFVVGDFIVDLSSQENTEINSLGDVRDVWQKLVSLLQNLSYIDALFADQYFTKFFNRYQTILYAYLWSGKQLHTLAKKTKYKQFRRAVLKTLAQQSDYLPQYNNDHSTILVQVLAEYWDTDQPWITAQQPRCNELKKLLSHFQKIDAVGANQLADRVTNDLANTSH